MADSIAIHPLQQVNPNWKPQKITKDSALDDTSSSSDDNKKKSGNLKRTRQESEKLPKSSQNSPSGVQSDGRDQGISSLNETTNGVSSGEVTPNCQKEEQKSHESLKIEVNNNNKNEKSISQKSISVSKESPQVAFERQEIEITRRNSSSECEVDHTHSNSNPNSNNTNSSSTGPSSNKKLRIDRICNHLSDENLNIDVVGEDSPTDDIRVSKSISISREKNHPISSNNSNEAQAQLLDKNLLTLQNTQPVRQRSFIQSEQKKKRKTRRETIKNKLDDLMKQVRYLQREYNRTESDLNNSETAGNNSSTTDDCDMDDADEHAAHILSQISLPGFEQTELETKIKSELKLVVGKIQRHFYHKHVKKMAKVSKDLSSGPLTDKERLMIKMSTSAKNNSTSEDTSKLSRLAEIAEFQESVTKKEAGDSPKTNISIGQNLSKANGGRLSPTVQQAYANYFKQKQAEIEKLQLAQRKFRETQEKIAQQKLQAQLIQKVRLQQAQVQAVQEAQINQAQKIHNSQNNNNSQVKISHQALQQAGVLDNSFNCSKVSADSLKQEGMVSPNIQNLIKKDEASPTRDGSPEIDIEITSANSVQANINVQAYQQAYQKALLNAKLAENSQNSLVNKVNINNNNNNNTNTIDLVQLASQLQRQQQNTTQKPTNQITINGINISNATNSLPSINTVTAGNTTNILTNSNLVSENLREQLQVRQKVQALQVVQANQIKVQQAQNQLNNLRQAQAVQQAAMLQNQSLPTLSGNSNIPINIINAVSQSQNLQNQLNSHHQNGHNLVNGHVITNTHDYLQNLDTIYGSLHKEGLTPHHLKKAKLMFFYTRYPNSSILKSYFTDVRFNRATTSQLIKWFSNFREFFYIHIEKMARQAVNEGVQRVEDLVVRREDELIRVLNNHYNKSNQFEVPVEFIRVTEASLREFFDAIKSNKDQDPSWKKVIYKIICKLDTEIPSKFKAVTLPELGD